MSSDTTVDIQRDPLGRAIDVSYRYAAIQALTNVCLVVPAGSSVALLGANGAGKTTLMQILTGRRRPLSGRAELFGGPPTDPAYRRRLGVTPQETGLPNALWVKEVVDFVAGHYADPQPTGEILDRFGLAGVARRQSGGLSGGQRRRLALALAFVGRPALVVLDEPTTGLDVESRRAVWDAIRDYHTGGGTVLLTSHDFVEVEALAQRVVVLATGRVIADGTPADMRDGMALSRVSYLGDRVPDVVGITAHRIAGQRVELDTPDAERLVRDLVAQGVPLRDLSVEPVSLEDAFLALIRRTGDS